MKSDLTDLRCCKGTSSPGSTLAESFTCECCYFVWGIWSSAFVKGNCWECSPSNVNFGNCHHQRWWNVEFFTSNGENDNSSSSNSGDLPLSKMVKHWYLSIIQNGDLTSECILKCSNFHRQMIQINHETLQTLSRSSQMIRKLLSSWTLLCMWII